ncbi:MAG TPA: glycoside hydrolase domain-containing protein [Streptosporangiaceae bacterium]
MRVPASWPVVRFAAKPAACPRLDVHAVYLGTPGPSPDCPAGLVGRSEAVMITPDAGAGGGPGAAVRYGTAVPGAGQAAARVLTTTVPRAGVRVTVAYRASRSLALAIRSSIRLTVGGHTAARSSGRPAARRASRASRPAPGPRRVVRAGTPFSGPGFDACAAPSASAMTKWLSSKFRAVGIYIGGINRACAQANLTSSWLTTIAGQGWHFFSIYPGLQSSCVLASGDATITTSKAAAEGTSAADDAAARAASLGIAKGTPLIFDMEAYGPACDGQVTTFLSAWDAELHARGYRAGVYESFTNIGALVKASGTITEPDVIYYADWDGHATTNSSYMPSAMWTQHQRIHQYLGGHLETHGGVSIDIDSDQLDVNLGSGPISGGSSRAGFRIAVAINSNGTAEWFARTAAGTLAHAWQAPVGSLTWSALHQVGSSPSGLASNPAASPQADGRLTVFARDSAGRIQHGWQQPGYPNDWEWGTPLPPPAHPAAGGTGPGAAMLPGHQVAVFESTARGVVTARQSGQNQNTTFTPWRNLGGSCTSTPVPVLYAGGTDVFCLTSAGTAAVDRWAGSSWSGWSQLPGSPSNLTGVPAVAIDGSGQLEFFAAAKAGGLADAWQAGAAGSWTWGSPLAGAGSAGGSGTTAGGSPSAATWPAGSVVVYSRLTGGQLGYIRHQGSSGSAGWSGWSTVSGLPGGKMTGSPAGWLNGSGAPSVAVLDGRLKLAVASNTGSGWSAWNEVGGGF